MSEMNKIDARQQLLVILMEECGELIQECSKNLRRGELYDREDFKNEVGDVYAMINLLHEWDVISWSEIEEREKVKREKLKKWSDLINDDVDKTKMDWLKDNGGEFYNQNISYTQDTGWRRALGDEPYNQNISYTQDMTGTGDYLTVSSEPLTPDEEKEWDRVYQKQVEESQKRGKENI